MKIGQTPPSVPAPSIQVTTARETGQDGARLTPGQIIKATVVGLNRDGTYLLDIDGQRITARSTLSLPTGGSLWLEVRGTAPPPLLAIAPQARVAGQELLLLLAGGMGNEQHIQTTIDQLLALLPGTSLADRLTQLAGQLRLMTTGGSSSPEQVLRSLIAFHAGGKRPPLLSLLREIGSRLPGARQLPAAAGAGDVFRRLEQFIGLTETVIALNGADLPPGYYIYPAFFEDGDSQGQWTIAPAGADQLQLDFYLRMSNLGDIHASFLIGANRIAGTFAVADEAAAAHVGTALSLLEKQFAALGFTEVSLASRTEEVRLLQRLRDRLLPEKQGAQASLIHITA